MVGIGWGMAAWRLAQSRTHQSSLAAPLQKRFAMHDAPSSEYWQTIKWVDLMERGVGPLDLKL